MDSSLRRDVRLLKGYALVTSVALVVLSLAAFRQTPQRQRFEEIDVERVNVVEKDGTPRLIFSNKARFPGLIVHGKEHPHPSRKTAGMLWFNEEGTENGGLTTNVQHDSTGTTAGGLITFDQYDQDQIVALRYDEHAGRRSAGLQVWDRPDYPIGRVLDALALPDGAEKTRRLEEFRNGNATRLYVGKTRDRAAVVHLADAQGRIRLRLAVDSAGVARVDFLDENGRVTSSLPSR